MKRIYRTPKATASVLLFGLLITIIIWPAIVFYPMGALLYRNDHPAAGADGILLLMGQADVRPKAAADILKKGMAQRIYFITSEINPLEEAGLVPSEEDLTKAVLAREGVTSEAVIVIRDYGRATSTVDEAIAVARYLGQMDRGRLRLIVVTSWPHSARAGWILEKALENSEVTVEMMPVDNIPYNKSDWWQSERGLLFIFEEYIKWARYLIKYLGRDIV